MRTLIIIVAALGCVFTCEAGNVSVTFPPQVSTVSIGTNIQLNSIQLTTQDASFNRGDFVWNVDYIPRTQFRTMTDTDGEGPGYGYFGRIQDFDLFTDWKLIDGQSNVVGIGRMVLPTYPITMMARIVFTNITLAWDTNQSTTISLVATLRPELATDVFRGFVSGDEVLAALTGLKIYSASSMASIDYSNHDAATYKMVVRPAYAIIASIRPVGNDLIITAYVDPNKSFMLQTSDDLASWYYGGGESVLSSKYGEIFFSVPKSQTPGQRYYRLFYLDNPDALDLVQIDILLPENAAGPIIPTRGVVQINSSVKAPAVVQASWYYWLADNGQTGNDPSFTPIFTAGVHWVKLLVRGAATDAPAFKWVIVR